MVIVANLSITVKNKKERFTQNMMLTQTNMHKYKGFRPKKESVD